MKPEILVILLIALPFAYSQCVAGQYQSGTGLCVACPPGTFSLINSVDISGCIPCNTGWFSNQFGRPNCTLCTKDLICGRGSPRPFTETELKSVIIDPSVPDSAQNWKIGFVFIMM